MTEITSAVFTADYRHIRAHPIPLYPTLALCRHVPSETKVFTITLDFPSEDYLEDHLNAIIEHPLYPGRQHRGVEAKMAHETTLTLLNFVKKSATNLVLIYEAYSSTIYNLVSKRISKNESFSVAELWKLLKRMVRIHVILEESGESSSGVGFGRIGILENGEIRGVWLLGGMGGPGGDGGQRGSPSDGWRESILREILQSGKKAVKELNPAPEICQSANEANMRG